MPIQNHQPNWAENSICELTTFACVAAVPSCVYIPARLMVLNCQFDIRDPPPRIPGTLYIILKHEHR